MSNYWQDRIQRAQTKLTEKNVKQIEKQLRNEKILYRKTNKYYF